MTPDKILGNLLKRDELFSTGDVEKVWLKYCGFLDLPLNEFMVIQKALLLLYFRVFLFHIKPNMNLVELSSKRQNTKCFKEESSLFVASFMGHRVLIDPKGEAFWV